METWSWIVFSIIALLQAVDVYTTKRILDRGGREQNPIMVVVMSRMGAMRTLVVTKVVTLAFLCAGVLAFGHTVLCLALLLCVLAWYLYWMAQNFEVYNSQCRY